MIKRIIVQFKVLTKKYNVHFYIRKKGGKTKNQIVQISTFTSWSYNNRISPDKN